MIGWYYLHINGELIYKPDSDGIVADLRESDFVRAIWPIDEHNRETAWNILVEALALNANKSRIHELANKWKCDNEDGKIYAARLDVSLEMDGSQWCAKLYSFTNLQECPAGFGNNVLEALAALCREMGYKEGKIWNPGFKDLIKRDKE